VLNTEACAAMGRGGEKISAPLYPHFYAYFPLISKFRQNRPRLFPLVLAHISLFWPNLYTNSLVLLFLRRFLIFTPAGNVVFFGLHFFSSTTQRKILKTFEFVQLYLLKKF
jgi:hypothetical protein